jgi:hypothetical protein
MLQRIVTTKHTTNTGDEYPFLCRDSIIQTKQASGNSAASLRGHRDRPSVSLTHYNIAPSDVVNLVRYRSALMLLLFSREG